MKELTPRNLQRHATILFQDVAAVSQYPPQMLGLYYPQVQHGVLIDRIRADQIEQCCRLLGQSIDDRMAGHLLQDRHE